MAEKYFAVLGSPIAHSLSPAIHNAAYQVLALNWVYERQELQAAQLQPFLGAAGAKYAGFSVTMPLKNTARQLAYTACEITQTTGAANTLVRLEAQKFAAFNTDVPALEQIFYEKNYSLLRVNILGAGATALSAALAAALAGARQINFIARRRSAAEATAGQLVSALAQLGLSQVAVGFCDFAGKQDSVAAFANPTFTVSALPGEISLLLPSWCIAGELFDVAYKPSVSAVGRCWQEQGLEITGGILMLQKQALLQLRIFVLGDVTKPLPQEAAVWAAIRAATDIK